MSQKENHLEDDEEGKSSGSGSAAFRLKPTEALFDPEAALSEGHPSEDASGGNSEQGSMGDQGGASIVVGEWVYYSDNIMLYHRRLKKRLMLEQLNSPTKMMKVIVALATQTGWETENLIRAMDLAAQKRFGKPLYQLMSFTQDSATFDWKSGQVRADNEKGRSAPSTHL